MTDQGYIKLHRSILSWEWYKNINTKIVFLHILLNANWEESKFEGHVIPKGSMVASVDSLSKSVGLSPKQTRVALNHLKRSGEVAIERANRFSIITVANWEKYQCPDEKRANERANERAIKGQSKGNIKEIKNIKKKENNTMPLKNCFYDFDKLEKDTREKSTNCYSDEKSKNPYKNYIHGNYDFEQIEKELKEK